MWHFLGFSGKILRENSFFPRSAAHLTPRKLLFIRKINYSRQSFGLLLESSISRNTPDIFHNIHTQMIVSGFASDTYLNNTLLNGYSKSSQLQYAQRLFDRIRPKNIISWSTIISMYSQHDLGELALTLFLKCWRSFSCSLNEFILGSVLSACTQLSDAVSGMQVHSFAIKVSLNSDIYVGTGLLDLYLKVGCLDSGSLVFEEIPVKSLVTWTVMISGYMQNGKSESALEVFKQMKETNLLLDRFIISSMLSVCSSLNYLEGGKQIHAYAYRNIIDLDISVNNVLIDFYAKCFKMKMARTVFDLMLERNLVSWTTLIASYMQNFYDLEALEICQQMNRLGWKPDAFACTSVMTSCGSLMSLQQGMQVHAYAVKVNLEGDDYVKNGLIDMYAKCNSLVDARYAFEIISKHNVVSCNAMIEGYARQDRLIESIDIFNRMRSLSLSPSLLTYVGLLGISASQEDTLLCKQIHGLVTKSGVLFDQFSASALTDAYLKCALADEARNVFEEIKHRDLVVWNSMITGYDQKDENEKVLLLFRDLCRTRLNPSEFTFACVLSASSNLASLSHGQQFHCQIIKVGLDSDHHVSSGLVEMYAKCGVMREARRVFNTACQHDLVCWNSLISRYSEHGHAEEALALFDQMLHDGIMPNDVTFLGVLSACSHVGLVELGLSFIKSMAVDFLIEPRVEHYACVVGLLGRAGRLHQAKELIEMLPIEPSAILWRTLLGACRIYGDAVLGQYAADKVMFLEPYNSGSYVLLSNILASKARWVDAEKVRMLMTDNGTIKEPGHSWIEVEREVHVFVCKDKEHEKIDDIYLSVYALTKLIRDVEYQPEYNSMYCTT